MADNITTQQVVTTTTQQVVTTTNAPASPAPLKPATPVVEVSPVVAVPVSPAVGVAVGAVGETQSVPPGCRAGGTWRRDQKYWGVDTCKAALLVLPWVVGIPCCMKLDKEDVYVSPDLGRFLADGTPAHSRAGTECGDCCDCCPQC